MAPYSIVQPDLVSVRFPSLCSWCGQDEAAADLSRRFEGLEKDNELLVARVLRAPVCARCNRYLRMVDQSPAPYVLALAVFAGCGLAGIVMLINTFAQQPFEAAAETPRVWLILSLTIVSVVLFVPMLWKSRQSNLQLTTFDGPTTAVIEMECESPPYGPRFAVPKLVIHDREYYEAFCRANDLPLGIPASHIIPFAHAS